MPAGFHGFPRDTLRFLRELQSNNNREWFEANKERHEDLVRTPALDFIEAMAKPIGQISPCLQVIPKKVGGSLMRIYRDVRFSKDKTPYKTNIGIQFRHQSGCDVHAPGLYVHIDPEECFLGVGTWHPASPALYAIRTKITEEPQEWKKASQGKAFASIYELVGESLKRPPRDFPGDGPFIEDLKRKDFIGVHAFKHREIHSADFLEFCTERFRKSKPFMRFLCNSLGVPF